MATIRASSAKLARIFAAGKFKRKVIRVRLNRDIKPKKRKGLKPLKSYTVTLAKKTKAPGTRKAKKKKKRTLVERGVELVAAVAGFPEILGGVKKRR